MRNPDEVRNYVIKVAAVKGWIVNPDEDFTHGLVAGLTANENRLGYYLCPCRDSHGSKSKDREILCPCVHASQDIKEFGHCYCALFLSPQFAAQGKEASSIPDRSHN